MMRSSNADHDADEQPRAALTREQASMVLSLFLAGYHLCCPGRPRHVPPLAIVDDPAVANALADYWFDGLGCTHEIPYADGDTDEPDDAETRDADNARGASRARRYFGALLEAVDPDAEWP